MKTRHKIGAVFLTATVIASEATVLHDIADISGDPAIVVLMIAMAFCLLLFWNSVVQGVWAVWYGWRHGGMVSPFDFWSRDEFFLPNRRRP